MGERQIPRVKTYLRSVVSLSKTLYSLKVHVLVISTSYTGTILATVELRFTPVYSIVMHQHEFSSSTLETSARIIL